MVLPRTTVTGTCLALTAHGSAELGEGGTDLRELGLERRRPHEVGATELELPAELLLVDAEQKLSAHPLVDRVAVGASAELGAQGDELRVLPSPPFTRRSRNRRWRPSAKWSGVSAASSGRSDGFLTTAASRSRSRCSPAPRTRGVDVVRQRRRGGGRGPRGRETGERLARKIETIGEEPQGVLALGRVLGARENLPRTHERLLAVVRPLELDPDAVVDVALGGTEPTCERVGRIGGILALRQRDDAHVESLPDGELHSAQRRLLPCGVGVEAEEEALRETAELAELVLGERRAHRRDDGLDRRLPEGDDVGVALDDDRAVLLRDGARARCRP